MKYTSHRTSYVLASISSISIQGRSMSDRAEIAENVKPSIKLTVLEDIII